MGVSPVDEIVDDCIAFRIRLIGRATTGLYEHALDIHGLSIAQLNLLAALGKVGPCPPARLGELLLLDRSTVSRNLSPMLKHGWVQAVSSDAKGIREIELTPSGRKKIQAALPDWRRAQEQATELLGAQGVRAVRALANTVGDLPTG
ncbi:MarR family winged helix-turn-helix transcriptional regulator [Mycolicibacterium brisbanense]|uniref:Regulatory protein MarR n=1 Tax=Mycolicibacterium brisbanense TaxID=146020 RepID=A0A100VWU4_9MYCO|nr:MarR family winged helix-turn-helix transcriptional regulator [Mycolicibacterium brisbanense]MCV7161554.1 winged helix-turn-helix transcriptional regulator [Mycolicibacterium brisbanense]GAS87472.1 regulatory protein MarR [Mycolicibacterium brisbanense]